MTAKPQKLLALSLAAAFGLAACNKQEPAPETAPQPAQTAASTPAPAQPETPSAASSAAGANASSEAATPQAPADLLADAAALQAAEDAFKALPQFGGKPVNVFQTIHFYGGQRSRIMLEVQDPNQPENVDHYEYEDGKWGEPQPVRLSGGGKMKDNVVPLKNIPFAAVAKIHKAWAEKAKEVGARQAAPEHIYFSLFVPTGKSKWYVEDIKTDRATYELEFKNDGTLKSFKKQ